MSFISGSGGVGTTVEISEIESLTKGSLIVGDGSGAPSELAVSSDNLALIGSSGASNGVAWSVLPIAGGGTGATTAALARDALGLGSLATKNALVLANIGAGSSAELATIISDETGSGLLVFATSPTLTTPAIGAATGTSLVLTGNLSAEDLLIEDSDASHYLTITTTSNLTAARTLTLVPGDAARTITLAGDLNIAADLITSGANSLTLTTSASTNVTLPTTGTLATLAGTETLSGKTLTAPKIANAGFIADANGNELVIFTTTASAVNEITIANGATLANPTITASGETNVGLDFQAKGTGTYRLLGTASQAAELRLFEDTDNGTNYTAFKVGIQAGDVTYTLPTADGSADQQLTTNGSGVLSWAAAGGLTYGSSVSGTTADGLTVTLSNSSNDAAAAVKLVAGNTQANQPLLANLQIGTSGNAMGLLIQGTGSTTDGAAGTGSNHATLWHDIANGDNTVISVGNGTSYTPHFLVTGKGSIIQQVSSGDARRFMVSGAASDTWSVAVGQSGTGDHVLSFYPNVSGGGTISGKAINTTTDLDVNGPDNGSGAILGKAVSTSLVWEFVMNSASQANETSGRTADYAQFKYLKSLGAATATDDYNMLYIQRSNKSNNAGSVYTSQGTVLKVENTATQTAGTLTDSVDVATFTQGTVSTGAILKGIQGSTTVYTLSTNGDVTWAPVVRTTGSPTLLTLTGPAHTTLTASVQATDVNFNLARTVQFATGALTTQRAFVIQAPTYGFAAASTLTNSVTVDITRCPNAGTNATLTTSSILRLGSVDPNLGATSAGMTYSSLNVMASVVTVTGTTQVTSACGFAAIRVGALQISDASAVTVDAAASIYIVNAPAPDLSTTITKAYSLWIDAGLPRIDSTTANGTVATAMSNLGPAGSNTTIQEWLTVDINGTTRYIPCF